MYNDDQKWRLQDDDFELYLKRVRFFENDFTQNMKDREMQKIQSALYKGFKHVDGDQVDPAEWQPGDVINDNYMIIQDLTPYELHVISKINCDETFSAIPSFRPLPKIQFKKLV